MKRAFNAIAWGACIAVLSALTTYNYCQQTTQGFQEQHKALRTASIAKEEKEKIISREFPWSHGDHHHSKYASIVPSQHRELTEEERDLHMVKTVAKLWTSRSGARALSGKNRIYYRINTADFNLQDEAMIVRSLKLIGEWTKVLEFVPLSSDDLAKGIKHLYYKSDGVNSGCWSYVGYDATADYTEINLEFPECKDGVVHETFHALGFQHEHQRYDRDDFIYVEPSHGDDTNYGAYSQTGDTSTFDTPFDYGSVMHYQLEDSNLIGAGGSWYLFESADATKTTAKLAAYNTNRSLKQALNHCKYFKTDPIARNQEIKVGDVGEPRCYLEGFKYPHDSLGGTPIQIPSDMDITRVQIAYQCDASENKFLSYTGQEYGGGYCSDKCPCWEGVAKYNTASPPSRIKTCTSDDQCQGTAVCHTAGSMSTCVRRKGTFRIKSNNQYVTPQFADDGNYACDNIGLALEDLRTATGKERDQLFFFGTSGSIRSVFCPDYAIQMNYACRQDSTYKTGVPKPKTMTFEKFTGDEEQEFEVYDQTSWFSAEGNKYAGLIYNKCKYDWISMGINKELYGYPSNTDTSKPPNHQIFTIERDPTIAGKAPLSDTFFIQNAVDGRYLTVMKSKFDNACSKNDVEGGKMGPPLELINDDGDDSVAQVFKFGYSGSIESVECPGMVLDLKGNKCDDLTEVILYRGHGEGNQRMKLWDNGEIFSTKCDRGVQVNNDGSKGKDSTLVLERGSRTTNTGFGQWRIVRDYDPTG